MKDINSHIDSLSKLRGELKLIAKAYPFHLNQRTYKGLCAVSAYLTFLYFKNRGFKAKIIHGNNHCWIEVGDYCLDMTATQFGIQEEILLLKKKKFYEFVEEESHYEINNVFDNEDDFKKEIICWISPQNPFSLKEKNKKMKQILVEYV